VLAPSLVSAPAETPVSLSEAKAHLRVDFSEDDTLIGSLIAAAVSHLDGYSGVLSRALVTQTWRADFMRWPESDRILRLPLAPVASVTSVKYFDASNVEQTLSASGNYALLTDHIGPYLRFTPSFTAPTLYDERDDAVRVTFVAGFGNATAVPQAIKAAILFMVADLYAQRETFSAGSMAPVPMSATVENLILPWRRVWAS
jgi:uncharacterized phiE125 gp8 family phage protein